MAKAKEIEKKPDTGFSLEVIEKSPTFENSLATYRKFEKDIPALRVTNTETQTSAVGTRDRLKVFKKSLEDEKKEFSFSADAYLKKVKSIYNPKIDAIEDWIDKVNTALIEYQESIEKKIRQEAARLEAEREAEKRVVLIRDIKNVLKKIDAPEEKTLAWLKKGYGSDDLKEITTFNLQVVLEKLIERAKKDSPEATAKLEAIENRPAPIEPPAPSAIVPKTVKTEDGSGVTFREDWDFEVVDANAVPREHMMPDEVKIRKLVRAGLRNIPGLRIFPKKVVTSTR